MRLVLIHRMSRTPLSLALLGHRLSQLGNSVRHFGYAALHESFDQIVGRLNDGVVAVQETRLRPNTEVMLVRSVHTLIMNSPQVTGAICQLLADSQK
jgi:hypothetical protein